MTISRNGGVVSGNGAGNEIVVSVGEQAQLNNSDYYGATCGNDNRQPIVAG